MRSGERLNRPGEANPRIKPLGEQLSSTDSSVPAMIADWRERSRIHHMNRIALPAGALIQERPLSEILESRLDIVPVAAKEFAEIARLHIGDNDPIRSLFSHARPKEVRIGAPRARFHIGRLDSRGAERRAAQHPREP